MKMFGILYTLFGLGVSGVGKMSQNIEDERKREEARKKGELTYYGKNGEHLVSNGRLITRTWNSDGDQIIKDMYNNTIYNNLTREKQDKILIEAKEKGKTVIDISGNSPFKKYAEKTWWFKNYRYKYDVNFMDVDTYCFYKEVNINGYIFYMDINTGLLVRQSDRDKDEHINNNLNKDNLSPEEIITLFNKRQLLYPNREQIIGNNIDEYQYYYLTQSRTNVYLIDKYGNVYIRYYSRFSKEYVKENITKGESI